MLPNEARVNLSEIVSDEVVWYTQEFRYSIRKMATLSSSKDCLPTDCELNEQARSPWGIVD